MCHADCGNQIRPVQCALPDACAALSVTDQRTPYYLVASAASTQEPKMDVDNRSRTGRSIILSMVSLNLRGAGT